MSKAGIEALRVCRGQIIELVNSLTPEEWEMQSDCEGWRVKDVIAHLANTCRSVADPDPLAPIVPGDLEATQAVQVESHRSWDSDHVRADYVDMSNQVLQTTMIYQEPRLADTAIAIENAGEYPLHLVADALTFDHYCHLRNDLLAPNGPLDRHSRVSVPVVLEATLNWLFAGLPQMCPEPIRSAVTAPVGMRLSGPGGGEWTLIPATTGDRVRVQSHLSSNAVAVISSSSEEFVMWSTHRRSWREREVRIAGNTDLGASVLDAIHLF